MKDLTKLGRRRQVALIRFALRCFPREFQGLYSADIERDSLELLDKQGQRNATRRTSAGMVAFSLSRAGVLERWRGRTPNAALTTLPTTPVPSRKASMSDLILRELRQSARSFAVRPGFFFAAVLTLAIGIGLNTAMFSIIDGVLLRPLPYESPETLIMLRRTVADRPGFMGAISRPDLRDLGNEAKQFETISGYRTRGITLTGFETPEIVPAAAVTSGLLDVFHVQPILGRDLVTDESVPGGPRLAVVSHDFWQRRLGADPRAVAQTLEIDEEPWTIVGIAPPGFAFPDGTQIWVPDQMSEEDCGRGCNLLTGVGRLRSEASVAQARLELDTIAARLESQYPEDNTGKAFKAMPLEEWTVGAVRSGLYLLFGAVGLVLLIASANVANLVLARGTTRLKETRLRAALGASRAALVRLLLLENLLLTLSGGVLGLGLGFFALRVFKALAPAGIPRLDEVGFRLPVFLFALFITAASALLVGIVPALRLSGAASGGARATANLGQSRSRSALLIAELALSLLLLIGATLFLRSLSRLLELDLGYSTDRVASFYLSLPDNRYPSPEKAVAFFDQLEGSLLALPEIESVGSILGRPLGHNSLGVSVVLKDRAAPLPGHEPSHRMRVVTNGYFETSRIPLIEGRPFVPLDRRDSLPVAIVNESFVRTYFADSSPIDKELELSVDFGWPELARRIVGVVGDVRSASLVDPPEPEVYVPEAQMGSSFLTVMFRSRTEAIGWPAISQVLAEIDPVLPLRFPETMNEVLIEKRGPARFYLLLLSMFAAVAALLAAVGLYGVVSFLVNLRRRETAIRMAVGADRLAILRHNLFSGFKSVVIGLLVGLTLATALTRTASSVLFDVSPWDPFSWIAATLLVAVISLGAIWFPAMRATRFRAESLLRAETTE